jgi:hypothetical protein
MVLEVGHCFILDGCDAICVDDNVVVVKEMKQVDDVIKFVV